MLSVVGNRPQFIKSAPLSVALRKRGIDEVTLHTGQHYDRELSQIFFEELDLPEPQYRLGVGGLGRDEMLAARPSIVYQAWSGSGWVEQEDKAPEARLFASWTADDSLSSRIDHHVAHYTGQDELAQAIQAGLEQRAHGDEAAATQLLGKAVSRKARRARRPISASTRGPASGLRRSALASTARRQYPEPSLRFCFCSRQPS